MKRTIKIGKMTIQLDFTLILILLWMCLLSSLALYTSFNLISTGSGSRYLMMQIVWYAVGFFVMFLISHFNNRILFRYMKPAYNFLMICLVYLFLSMLCIRFFGFHLPLAPDINGAVSWFRIPFISSFQPSEFIKIVLIILCARTITKFQRSHRDPSPKDDFLMLWEIAKVLLPPLILIFLQPDTGVCIIIGFTILVMILCSGIRKEYIYGLFGLLIFVVALFFYLYFFQHDFLSSIISNYRLQRIDAWLDPESNIRGSSNQLYTALLSLGSAGFFGYGLQPRSANRLYFRGVWSKFWIGRNDFDLGLLYIVGSLFVQDRVCNKKPHGSIDRDRCYRDVVLPADAELRNDRWFITDHRDHPSFHFLWRQQYSFLLHRFWFYRQR